MKTADISKIKTLLLLKGIFSEITERRYNLLTPLPQNHSLSPPR